MPLSWLIPAAVSVLISLAAGDYVISPTSVPLSVRQNWCFNQQQTCPLICQQVPPGSTLVNSCDPVQLTYGCLCGNNMQPNVSEYTLTMPFFVCQQWQIQCQGGCPSHDNTCIASCTQDHPCGAQNPQRVNLTSPDSSSSSITSSAASVFGATATDAAAPTSTGPVVYTGPGSQTAATTSLAVARVIGSFSVALLACGFAVLIV